MKSVVKSMFFILQNVSYYVFHTETPLRAPIPPISHFDILSFKPENWEKISSFDKLIEFSFFKKKL